MEPMDKTLFNSISQVETWSRQNRCSRSQMFFRIGALKIFANFTRKHLLQTPTQVFSCDI